MAQIIFVRHGESSANVDKVLAGRTPGVHLSSRGVEQVTALREAISAIAPQRIVRSSVLRCRETAELLFPDRHRAIAIHRAFDEVDYGQWSGRRLADLGRLSAWAELVAHPGSVEFPGGESLAEAYARARRGVAELLDGAGEGERIVVVTHGDIVKFALLDALGLGLGGLHRLTVATGTFSLVDYTRPDAPMVCAVSAAGPAQRARGTLGG
jgi:broad specificity phosphatase PhoE